MTDKKKRFEWDDWLELAKAYYEEHGNLRIQYVYQTSCGKKLGKWIDRQRAAYKGKGTYLMTEDRITALEAIGMEWSLETRTPWDVYYQYATEYYKKHRHLRIPSQYKTADGLWLGEWIKQQRKKHKQNLLTSNQVKKLDKIGMKWFIILRPTWDEWYEMASQYKEEHGNINVPISYKTQEGHALGTWLSCQRCKYKNNPTSLKPEQIEALENLGVIWNIYDYYWWKMYEIAKKYYLQNGNVNVSPKYITSSGERLGQWIKLQKENSKKNRYESSRKERITLLKEIGIAL